ncbi:MAG TPA: UV DNA damage repair endonuclease UvsE [Thermoanaerobaculia bacterium]|nr:UV DNA damage repair endonuclease UvsE [Thermoanaerobaculia bacterium]
MLRLGLCCGFVEEPIKFRTATAAHLSKLPRREQLDRLAEIAAHNARALAAAVDHCAAHGIGAFRINSQVLPLYTHPQVGYRIEDLPGGDELAGAFEAAGGRARDEAIRLLFHPDQFVVLNSPRPEVVEASLAELEYQAEVAGRVGADVINLHAGGVFGDKPAALDRLARSLDRLSPAARTRLTLENDDRSYTPADLLPFCHRYGVPLIYDVHHHRCHPDGARIEETTAAALATWNREPVLHLSSPREGWTGPHPRRHHDFIDPADVPDAWHGLPVTVEVEAKAKELAVKRLRETIPLKRRPERQVRRWDGVARET